MLNSRVVVGQPIAVPVRERQPPEAQVPDGLVPWPGLVDRALDPDQFPQRGRHDAFRNIPAPRPQVELACLRVQHPLARFVEFIEHVLDPARLGVLQEVKGIQRVCSVDGRAGGPGLLVDRRQWQDVDDPGVVRADNDLHVLKVGPVLQPPARKAENVLRAPLQRDEPGRPRAGQQPLGVKEREEAM